MIGPLSFVIHTSVRAGLLMAGVAVVAVQPAAQGRRAAVAAWQGVFTLEYERETGTERIRNRTEGSFVFTEHDGEYCWTGEGTATWSADQFARDFLNHETTVKGSGQARLGEPTELCLDPIGGTYDVILLPGGEYRDGMQVTYFTTMPRFDDGGALGMPMPAKPEPIDGPLDTYHLTRAGLRGEIEEVRLPADGLRLCGSTTLEDGTRATWDAWPRGAHPAGPCPR